MDRSPDTVGQKGVGELLGLVTIKIMHHPMSFGVRMVEISIPHQDPLRQHWLENVRNDNVLEEISQRLAKIEKDDPEWNL